MGLLAWDLDETGSHLPVFRVRFGALKTGILANIGAGITNLFAQLRSLSAYSSRKFERGSGVRPKLTGSWPKYAQIDCVPVLGFPS